MHKLSSSIPSLAVLEHNNKLTYVNQRHMIFKMQQLTMKGLQLAPSISTFDNDEKKNVFTREVRALYVIQNLFSHLPKRSLLGIKQLILESKISFSFFTGGSMTLGEKKS